MVHIISQNSIIKCYIKCNGLYLIIFISVKKLENLFRFYETVILKE